MILFPIDHWQDVLAGSILGLVMSYFAYRQYYPHLASRYSHRPYLPRFKSPQDSMTLPLHRNPEGSSRERLDAGRYGGYRDSSLTRGDDGEGLDGETARQSIDAKDERRNLDRTWEDEESGPAIAHS